MNFYFFENLQLFTERINLQNEVSFNHKTITTLYSYYQSLHDVWEGNLKAHPYCSLKFECVIYCAMW